MKKKVVSVLMVAAMGATLLAGCGSSSSSSSSSSDSSSSSSSDVGSGEITIWVASEVQDLTLNAAEQFLADKGYDYTVTVEAVGESDAASNVITDVEGAADIYGFAQDQLTRLIAAGGIQPLTDEYATWVEENNTDGASDAVKSGGTTYAFPITADNTYVLFYDSSVVTDPTSLEQVMADCEAAGKNFYFNYDSWYLESFFMATGCTFEYESDEDGNFTSANIDMTGEKGQIALQAMLDLSASDYFQRGSDAGAAVDYAAIVDGTWDTETISAALGDNMACAVLPSFTGTDGNTYALKPWNGFKMIGIKPQTDAGKLQVCYELAQYLSDTEVSLERFEQNGWGPSNLAALENDEIANDPVLTAVGEQGDWSVAQGNFPNDYWTILNTMGDDAQNHTTGDDLEAYLEGVQAQLEALVD